MRGHLSAFAVASGAWRYLAWVAPRTSACPLCAGRRVAGGHVKYPASPQQHLGMALSTNTTPPTGSSSSQELVDRVLDFWIGRPSSRYGVNKEKQALWFSGSNETDKNISDMFGADVERALDNDSAGLTKLGPRGGLTLVILLDQFARNCFRGTEKAFAGDEAALRVALMYYGDDDKRAEAKEHLNLCERFFLYMPLMHAEDVGVGENCVKAMRMLVDESDVALQNGDVEAASGKAAMEGSCKFAESHLEILRKFGRYPYRNAALGRTSTPAEFAFLEDGPRFGQ